MPVAGEGALDFHLGYPPQPYLLFASSPFYLAQSGMASMSDSLGNLLFYSDGINFYDSTQNVTPNGAGLLGHRESTQGCLIVPWPGDTNRYYLFTADLLGGINGLRYSEIDRTLNGGMGDLTSVKNFGLHIPVCEKITAVKHANNRDYWVIAHEWQSDAFLAFLVTDAGITAAPVISNVGTVIDGWNGQDTIIGGNRGQMKVSPNGDHIALAGWIPGVRELFDFDRATGTVSNSVNLGLSFDVPYGVEFSPDGTKLYMSYHNNWDAFIDQWDLEDCNILDSHTRIASLQWWEVEVPGSLQLGPDGRIYLLTEDCWVNAIEEPNQRGVACNYNDSVVQVPYHTKCAQVPSNNTSMKGLGNFITSYFNPEFIYRKKCHGDTMEFSIPNTWNHKIDSAFWDFGDPSSGAANTSTAMAPTHIFTRPDTFAVSMTYYIGAEDRTFTYDVVVHPLPGPVLGNDTTICAGQSITLDAHYPGPTYHQWFDGTTDSTVTITANSILNPPGVFWVDNCRLQCHYIDTIRIGVENTPPSIDLGNDSVLCEGDTLLLAPGLSLTSLVWQDTLTAQTYPVGETGTYRVEASNGCGSSFDTINVSFTPAPTFDLGNDTNLCPGVSFPLAAEVSADGYLWQDGTTTDSTFTATTAGIYWVAVNSLLCGVNTDSITISYDLPPTQINLQPGSTSNICQGDTLVLISPTSLEHAFAWSNNSSDTFLVVVNSGTYSLTVTNICGSANQSVTFDFAAPLNPVLGSDTGFCEGGFVVIGPEAEDGANYQWNDGTPGRLRTVDQAGIFTVLASNPCGVFQDNQTISINSNPVVNLGLDQVFCNDPKTILNPGFPGFSHLWQDGSTAESLLVLDEGTYWVMVSDSIGCSGLDSVSFVENCIAVLEMPNVLTPNGDGMNDEFRIPNKHLNAFRMQIFNRWGHLVFQSERVEQAWDGVIDGTIAPSGTYYYLVEYEGFDGAAQKRQGTFSLLR